MADGRAGRAAGAAGTGARVRVSGDTTMLAYDTAEGPAATRRQYALCARPCTAWARPGRRMGVLAGSAEPSWCTVHLAQF